MKPIAAVIFDMDGVLLDSEPLHLRATQAVLSEQGASYTERDNRAFFGATDAEMFRALRIRFNLSVPTPVLVEAKRQRLVELVRTEARPMPGIPGILRWLREAGLRLALASSSPPAVIGAALDTLGLDATFEVVVSGDEVARGKPAPDVFLTAASRLGIEARRCLVVEDSRNGVLAGKTAGMIVAAVPCPATRHEDFSAADLVLPSLEGLRTVLGQNGP